MTKCSVLNCNNNLFGSFDKCALHCLKGEYQSDSLSGLLPEFSKLLNKYIVEQLIDMFTSVGNSYKANFIRNLDTDNKFIFEYHANTNLNLILRDEILFLQFIHFPMRKPQDHFDYFNFFKIFKGVYFDECHFYLGVFADLSEREVFFDVCTFKKDVEIIPMKIIAEKSNALFYRCFFESYCVVKPSQYNHEFQTHIFSGGAFKKDLTIQNIVAQKEIFIDYETTFIFIKDTPLSTSKVIEKRRAPH